MPNNDDYNEEENSPDCEVERCEYCGKLPEYCSCEIHDKWD